MGKENTPVVEIDLNKRGLKLGVVEIPVREFWAEQQLTLRYGDNSLCPDYVALWSPNRALVGKLWVESIDMYRAEVLPQFAKKVCGGCPNNSECLLLPETGSRRIEIRRGETQKDFEARVRQGKCVNPEKLVVNR